MHRAEDDCADELPQECEVFLSTPSTGWMDRQMDAHPALVAYEHSGDQKYIYVIFAHLISFSFVSLFSISTDPRPAQVNDEGPL
jgi:hypothetical protein